MQLHKCCEPFFRKARSVNAADTAHASPDRAWPSLAFYVKKTDSCRVLFVSHLKVIPKAFQSYSKGLKLGKWCHFWIVNLVLEALLFPCKRAASQKWIKVLTRICLDAWLYTPYPSVLDFWKIKLERSILGLDAEPLFLQDDMLKANFVMYFAQPSFCIFEYCVQSSDWMPSSDIYILHESTTGKE